MTHPPIRLVQLRPRAETDYISFDYAVLVTSRDGFIYPERNDGLFMHRTRLLSRYRYVVNGEQFIPVTLSVVHQNRWFGYYIRSTPESDDSNGNSTVQTLELTVARELSAGGLCELLELTNYSQHRTQFEFGIELGADFADQDEAQSGKRVQHGTIREQFNRHGANEWKLTIDYRATHDYSVPGEAGTAEFHRGVEVQIKSMAREVWYRDGALRCQVALDSLKSARFELRIRQIFDNGVTQGPFRTPKVQQPPNSVETEELLQSAAKVSIPSVELNVSQANKTISQAAGDLCALRMYCLDRHDGWIPAAGLPEYLAFFGRDILITAMESAMLGSQMMRGALGHLAQWQTTRTNDWRDEQPGRMLHQAEIGPMTLLNFTPLSLYYGTITTPALFPWALGRLWKWTADRTALAALIEPALKGLGWLDNYCLSEKTGFYHYSTHSPKGIKNQGWKDSGDAIVYEDGSQVDNPIAICDCQGYVYMSKMEAAHMLDQLSRHDEAAQLRTQAAELKRRFNEVFWMPEMRFFAMGLDKDGNQIRSIGSNPLHCLRPGIIDDSLVKPTVERLFEPDLYSGWGVRTLSNCHPAYNPHSYQRGSVWPFEHGSLSLGLAYYGFHQQLERVVHDQFDAAALFEHNRLPEVFGGHQRDPQHPFPSVYPQSNWPQAWSAASIFAHLEALLGLQPDAPAKSLTVDPHLPQWLPDLQIRGLQVGDAVIDLTFQRRADGETEFKVERMSGTIEIIRRVQE